MNKIILAMMITVSFSFSAINLQTASKNELMCIKGIGIKKAEAIIAYRKSNKLKSPDDLINIKGFGKKLIDKVKRGEKTLKCTNNKKKSTNKKVVKKVSVKKDNNKTSSSKIDKK